MNSQTVTTTALFKVSKYKVHQSVQSDCHDYMLDGMQFNK